MIISFFYLKKKKKKNFWQKKKITQLIYHFVCLFALQNLVMQHVDHSAGYLIDLLQGLLRYDPSSRLTAHDALKHPFFARDYYRRI